MTKPSARPFFFPPFCLFCFVYKFHLERHTRNKNPLIRRKLYTSRIRNENLHFVYITTYICSYNVIKVGQQNVIILTAAAAAAVAADM